jgi:hypothetical protein
MALLMPVATRWTLIGLAANTIDEQESNTMKAQFKRVFMKHPPVEERQKSAQTQRVRLQANPTYPNYAF